MRILGIESSCDDSAMAVIEIQDNKIKILGNIVSTQTIHAGYGGVFPMMAKREHIKNLPIVYEEIIRDCGENFDAIALTVGPGLPPSLWAGITFAEELSKKLNIPIIPVNHMEGHLLSAIIPEFKLNEEMELKGVPENSICLLVSGGHTQIVHIEKLGKYKILGTTLDDAVGEAFDKVARMMDLPYPGGPAISRLAEANRADVITMPSEASRKPNFPRPMLHSKDYNFSFSGLKTAVLYYIRDNPIKNEEDKMMIAKEFEDSAIEVIIKKVADAMEEYGSSHILLGGGVAANRYLQNELKKLAEERKFEIYFPIREIIGDNALMIALAGYFNKEKATNEPQKAIGTWPLS